jgi:hypothetical protein
MKWLLLRTSTINRSRSTERERDRREKFGEDGLVVNEQARQIQLRTDSQTQAATDLFHNTTRIQSKMCIQQTASPPFR